MLALVLFFSEFVFILWGSIKLFTLQNNFKNLIKIQYVYLHILCLIYFLKSVEILYA